MTNGFKLSKCAINIDWSQTQESVMAIDIDETTNQGAFILRHLPKQSRDFLNKLATDETQRESRKRTFAAAIVNKMSNFTDVPTKEIRDYVERILEDFSDEEYRSLSDDFFSYVSKIDVKVKTLLLQHRREVFRNWIDTNRIIVKETYALPEEQILPIYTEGGLPKTLYDKEGKLNDFEKGIISKIGSMASIQFWTRNTDRRGFCLNGYINHYPDFIVVTQSGLTVLVETKGDHLDGTDSEGKIELGASWSNLTHGRGKYFMVFKEKEVKGARKVDAFLRLLEQLE